MALRLAGPPVPAVGGHDIVSDGVMPGSIQIPGSAQPLVLLRDCQTMGGYPKIASVISADLDALAQCCPGTTLRFAVVTPEEACLAARDRAARMRELRAEADREHVPEDPGFLLATNLIGGVTDGTD
jgi:allophanate hydrolase subunit 2